MRPVFVVGCPRSGTSWVRNILGGHPSVHAGPESHLYPTVHGVVSAWADDTERWSEVTERYDALAGHGGSGPHRWIDRNGLNGLLAGASLGHGDRLQRADDVVAGVLDHYVQRFRLAADVVLVEKTPDHLRWAERILDRFPDARIVEVRRDGRDVCVSMERRAQRVAWPPRERRDQIVRWSDAIELGLRFATDDRFRHRWHVVRFEDLVGDRHGELRALFDFVQLTTDRRRLAEIATATDISLQRGTGDGEHVRTGAVGDWRTYFDGDDRRLFELLAGDLLRRVGYR